MVQAMDLMWFNKNLIESNKNSIKVNQNLIKINKSGFSGLGGGPPGRGPPWGLGFRF